MCPRSPLCLGDGVQDALYEELGFVETPEEAEEDYKLLHEQVEADADAQEDLDTEKRSSPK